MQKTAPERFFVWHTRPAICYLYSLHYDKILIMSKKQIAFYTGIPVAIIALSALWLQTTHDGRVLGLYSFAALRAPFDAKMTCAKETNIRVAKKFEAPLNFDEDSKNALREFWHFSYYRECLFKAGFDFYGNPIEPASLTPTGNDRYTYKNPFAGIEFTTDQPTTLVYSNITNPDLDDYTIASLLMVSGEPISVHFDRSYKQTSRDEFTTAFAGFESKEGFTSETLERLPDAGDSILHYADGELVGYVIHFPGDHIVTVYGQKSAEPILEKIATTIKTLSK